MKKISFFIFFLGILAFSSVAMPVWSLDEGKIPSSPGLKRKNDVDGIGGDITRDPPPKRARLDTSSTDESRGNKVHKRGRLIQKARNLMFNDLSAAQAYELGKKIEACLDLEERLTLLSTLIPPHFFNNETKATLHQKSRFYRLALAADFQQKMKLPEFLSPIFFGPYSFEGILNHAEAFFFLDLRALENRAQVLRPYIGLPVFSNATYDLGRAITIKCPDQLEKMLPALQSFMERLNEKERPYYCWSCVNLFSEGLESLEERQKMRESINETLSLSTTRRKFKKRLDREIMTHYPWQNFKRTFQSIVACPDILPPAKEYAALRDWFILYLLKLSSDNFVEKMRIFFQGQPNWGLINKEENHIQEGWLIGLAKLIKTQEMSFPFDFLLGKNFSLDMWRAIQPYHELFKPLFENEARWRFGSIQDFFRRLAKEKNKPVSYEESLSLLKSQMEVFEKCYLEDSLMNRQCMIVYDSEEYEEELRKFKNLFFRTWTYTELFDAMIG